MHFTVAACSRSSVRVRRVSCVDHNVFQSRGWFRWNSVLSYGDRRSVQERILILRLTHRAGIRSSVGIGISVCSCVRVCLGSRQERIVSSRINVCATCRIIPWNLRDACQSGISVTVTVSVGVADGVGVGVRLRRSTEERIVLAAGIRRGARRIDAGLLLVARRTGEAISIGSCISVRVSIGETVGISVREARRVRVARSARLLSDRLVVPLSTC